MQPSVHQIWDAGDDNASRSRLNGSTPEVLEKTDACESHAKTEWSIATRPSICWWVGWIERENKSYPFALNIEMTSDSDAEKRISIARACLQALDKF